MAGAQADPIRFTCTVTKIPGLHVLVMGLFLLLLCVQIKCQTYINMQYTTCVIVLTNECLLRVPDFLQSNIFHRAHRVKIDNF